MDTIKEFLITFLNNENYINVISIFVVAFTSYQVAKYNTSRPNKLKIKQLQLDYVYLPLYRILIDSPQLLDKRRALEIYKKVNTILNSHYELAFPQLHQLNRQLKDAILNDKDYNQIIRIIFHQVTVDYELLKKSLGYPSESFFTIFVRMTKKQKCLFIISWVNVIWIFLPMFLLLPLAKIYPTYGIFICTAIVIVVGIPLLKLNDKIKKMND